MMDDFMYRYFGPVNKQSCVYFLYFSFVGFIFLVLASFAFIVGSIMHFKKLNMMIVFNFLMIMISYFLLYYSNRILYTICVKTL